MKEIIQELLRVETEAKKAVADAEDDARRIVADARSQAQSLLDARRQKAADDAQRLVGDRLGQARAEKQTRLEQAKAANHSAVCVTEQSAREAVDLIVRAATGT